MSAKGRDLLREWLNEEPKRGRGRPPNRAEVDIAIAVEMERLKRGIPANRLTTPEGIFARVAKEHGVSKRSVESYYPKHRKFAQEQASFVRTLLSRMPAWDRLRAKYGDGVPLSAVKKLLDLEADLKPSDMPRFEDRVRELSQVRSGILARKSRKPAK